MSQLPRDHVGTPFIDPTQTAGAVLAGVAENFALGPGADVFASPGGTSIPWTTLAVGAPGINVPITPTATGNVIIQAAIALRNIGITDEDDIFVKVQVNGVDVPPGDVQISMDQSQARVVPVLTRVVLPLNVTANVSIVVTGAATISIDSGNSTIEIHEAPVATG